MHWKIYLPGSTFIAQERLAEIGLASLCEDVGPEWEMTSVGPDGKPGAFLSWNRTGTRAPEGTPAGWRWQPAPPGDGVPQGAWWFGWDPADRPGPLEFERLKQYAGHVVCLRDNTQWCIPSAHYAPETYGINWETGKKDVTIDPRWQRFCFTAFKHAQAFFTRDDQFSALARLFRGTKLQRAELEHAQAIAEECLGREVRIEDITSLPIDELRITVPLDDAIDHAWDALAINYRVNPVIVSCLELLDRAATTRICLAVIDIPAIEYSLKKNEPDKPITLPLGLTS